MKPINRFRTEWASNRILRDSWLLAILGLNLLGLVFLLGWSFTHIHPTEIQVPVRFSSIGNFDQLGPWYQLYDIVGIGVGVFIVNLLFAGLLHKKNRLLSILMAITSLMVVVLCSAVLIGFTVVNYGAS